MVASKKSMDQTKIQSAKRDAERLRAKWLFNVSTGQATIFDAIEAAKLPFNEPLAQMKLYILMRALFADRPIEKIISSALYEVEWEHSCRVAKQWKDIRLSWFVTDGSTPQMLYKRREAFGHAYLSHFNYNPMPNITFPWEH
jgi:hypothetical protein